MSNRQHQPTRLQDYRAPDYLVDRVDLDFDLREEATTVRSRLEFRRNETAGPAAPLVLNGEDLELLSIRLDGRPLAAGEYQLGHATLTLPAVADRFTLEVANVIRPASNTRLEGLYLSGGIYCTQCEAQGFRHITYFPDRPDVMATYRTTIRASRDLQPVLLSNGNLVDAGDLPDGRHFAVWEDPFRKPCYLFALVAGRLGSAEDRFVTASGREVQLRIFVEPGKEGLCAWAMESLKQAMRWDEEVFGLEYDLGVFNIVAVSDFNMGAMENKSLNVFNDKYILASPATATDTDYAGIEAVVAHEYFHNWTGNRVTCRDWFQLSLKEGLTVFRDQQFSADMRSRPVQRIRDVRQVRARQFPEDAGPLAHPVRPDSYIEINNFYTATVYEKGAEVIRMLHTLLGPDRFRAGMDLYFARHDGQAVTCDDFRQAMADASGTDLSGFAGWYSQAGTPRVEARTRYDASGRTFELMLTQQTPPTPGQPEKQPLPIPLEVGLLDAEGNDLPLRIEGEAAADGTSRVLLLDGSQRTFRFLDVPAPPVPSINRNFSAPIKLDLPIGDAERLLLMANDSDPFNRWEAGQQFAVRLLLDGVAAIGRGEPLPSADAFAEALGHSLGDSSLDRAFLAEMIALPSEAYLGDQLEVVEVEAIHEARKALRLAIAGRLRPLLLEIYHAHRDNQPYSPDAASAGRRALRNGVLGYLAALPEAEMLALVRSQYFDADNMTERLGALALLCDMDVPARREALDDFYGRYRTDPLVLDKWLSLQASSSLPGTLDEVRRLQQHPAYLKGNPNKVRALIGGFANLNPVRFHAADGSGYAFLADQIIDIDRSNPQLAAQILAPLGRWRRHVPKRQAAMRGALQRILESPTLSPNVYELASKSLA